MPEPYRAALYYAPEAADPLWTQGCAWLGRDPETGLALPQQAFAAMTTEPSCYGFHATLKAPMRLQHGLARFLRDAEALAAQRQCFVLPPLAVTNLHGFLALCPTITCAETQALAASCVTELDHHRVPEDAASQAKRAAGRSEAQRENIERWGYPLVLDEFQFHMTLTNKIEDNFLVPQAKAHFAAALAMPRRVTSIAVFVEDAPGAPFRLLRRLKLST